MIEVNDVSKTIKQKIILNSLNATFEEGHAYLIKGHNGSGKSMLLRLISGLLKPSTGELRTSQSYRFGVIIESPHFLMNETGLYNLKYLANIRKVIGIDEIYEVMKTFNLYDKKDDKVKTYSLGMKQRLALCQAFMEDPDVLLLDEPFNALDDKNSEVLIQKLIEFKEKGKIIIIAAHGLDRELESMFDEIIYMVDGTIE